MEQNKTITEIRRESESSYEFGKASNRFKLYFWTTEELLRKLKELEKAGLYFEDLN